MLRGCTLEYFILECLLDLSNRKHYLQYSNIINTFVEERLKDLLRIWRGAEQPIIVSLMSEQVSLLESEPIITCTCSRFCLGLELFLLRRTDE